MGISIIEAVQLGQWDFEPADVPAQDYDSTSALPGTNEKLQILAERLSQGLPLWHPQDRLYWGNDNEGQHQRQQLARA